VLSLYKEFRVRFW